MYVLSIAERYQVKFLEIGTDKGSCSFFGAISADIHRDEVGDDDQKFDCTRDIQALSAYPAACGGDA